MSSQFSEPNYNNFILVEIIIKSGMFKELIWRVTIEIFAKVSYNIHFSRIRIACNDHL